MNVSAVRPSFGNSSPSAAEVSAAAENNYEVEPERRTNWKKVAAWGAALGAVALAGIYLYKRHSASNLKEAADKIRMEKATEAFKKTNPAVTDAKEIEKGAKKLLETSEEHLKKRFNGDSAKIEEFYKKANQRIVDYDSNIKALLEKGFKKDEVSQITKIGGFDAVKKAVEEMGKDGADKAKVIDSVKKAVEKADAESHKKAVESVIKELKELNYTDAQIEAFGGDVFKMRDAIKKGGGNAAAALKPTPTPSNTGDLVHAFESKSLELKTAKENNADEAVIKKLTDELDAISRQGQADLRARYNV